MTNPLVSVIIPVYNVSPYIEECLNSVIRQTYTPLEVIVVDDCCTDDSMAKVNAIVDNYHGEILFSLLHHERNRGLSAARNSGLDVATGTYISFIDSDDYILPTFYETLVRAFEGAEEHVAILGCRCLSNLRIDNKSNNSIKTIPPEQFAGEFLSARTIGVAWGKLYRKHLFDSIRFREGRNGEDFLLIYDMYPLIERLHYTTVILPDQLYYYRIREDSITGSKLTPYTETKTRNLQEVVKGLKKAKHACLSVVEERYLRHLYQRIVTFANQENSREFFRYCFKLWGFSDCSAKRKLPDRTDFKPFLLMKYLPSFYYFYIKFHKNTPGRAISG